MAAFRVVVVFDSTSDAVLAEMAALLAKRLGAELSGVFVVPVEAESFARLPFASLIEESGRLHPLDADAVRSLFRVAALRAERELGRSAARGRVASSFRVTRGPFQTAIARAEDAPEVVVVPSIRRSAHAGPIAIALTEGGGGQGLLEIAHAIATKTEPLVALIPDDPKLREMVASFAREHARPVLLQRVNRFDPEMMARALDRVSARLLLVSERGPLVEQGIERLRRALSCPLVIFR